ncbi:MAG: hypothetical protein P8X94_06295, partial [Woeseiaceae bacterium]
MGTRTTDAAALEALAAGRHGNPFALLGPQRERGKRIVRTLQPGASAVRFIDDDGAVLGDLAPAGHDGLFAGQMPARRRKYR